MLISREQVRTKTFIIAKQKLNYAVITMKALIMSFPLTLFLSLARRKLTI